MEQERFERLQALRQLLELTKLGYSSFLQTFPTKGELLLEQLLANQESNINELTIKIDNHMKDQYNITNSQMNSVGPNSNGHNNQFHQQINHTNDKELLEKIGSSLTLLRKELESENSNSDNLEMIVEIGSAELAVKKEDRKKLSDHLRSIVNWMIQTGKDIGLTLMKEWLEKQAGIS